MNRSPNSLQEHMHNDLPLVSTSKRFYYLSTVPQQIQAFNKWAIQEPNNGAALPRQWLLVLLKYTTSLLLYALSYLKPFLKNHHFQESVRAQSPGFSSILTASVISVWPQTSAVVTCNHKKAKTWIFLFIVIFWPSKSCHLYPIPMIQRTINTPKWD